MYVFAPSLWAPGTSILKSTARWGSGKQCVTVQRIVPMALTWDYRNVPWKHKTISMVICVVSRDVVSDMSRNQFEIHWWIVSTAGMVDEFRVIFDIIDSNGSGELDLLGVKRACGLLGQKRLLDRRWKIQYSSCDCRFTWWRQKCVFSSKRMRRTPFTN